MEPVIWGKPPADTIEANQDLKPGLNVFSKVTKHEEGLEFIS